LRDLAASNVFPGDLLLKNFGVTSHGRVIFYDYDEICLVSDCVFRDLPTPKFEEEETSAEPWFHCGPRDVFPEQWLPFLGIPPALSTVFIRHHADLLTAAWWRTMSTALAAGHSVRSGAPRDRRRSDSPHGRQQLG
jgi:isocitrate dehydrogenase kinase/phosphatase